MRDSNFCIEWLTVSAIRPVELAFAGVLVEVKALQVVEDRLKERCDELVDLLSQTKATTLEPTIMAVEEKCASRSKPRATM